MSRHEAKSDRTPEGQDIRITPERAIEWTADRRFIDEARKAVWHCPAPYRLPADPTE